MCICSVVSSHLIIIFCILHATQLRRCRKNILKWNWISWYLLCGCVLCMCMPVWVCVFVTSGMGSHVRVHVGAYDTFLFYCIMTFIYDRPAATRQLCYRKGSVEKRPIRSRSRTVSTKSNLLCIWQWSVRSAKNSNANQLYVCMYVYTYLYVLFIKANLLSSSLQLNMLFISISCFLGTLSLYMLMFIHTLYMHAYVHMYVCICICQMSNGYPRQSCNRTAKSGAQLNHTFSAVAFKIDKWKVACMHTYAHTYIHTCIVSTFA